MAWKKETLVNRLMDYFSQTFSSLRSPLPHTTTNAGDTGTEQAGNSSEINIALPSTSHPPKRHRANDNGDEDSNAGNRRRKRVEMEDSLPRAKPKRLACPYFKKDPNCFQTKQSCCGPGWETVHRLKEHLYRNHCLPISCLRCYMPFESEDDRNSHMRSSEQCELRQPPPSIAGFDSRQCDELKARPRDLKNMSEPQKWRRVYLILFPGTLESDIPSPYYEFKTIRDPGHPIDLMIEYEEYLERELPPFVRQQLDVLVDNALNPLEETLRGQLVDIVRNAQVELYRRFRSSVRPHSGEEAVTTEQPLESIDVIEAGPSDQGMGSGNTPRRVPERLWNIEDALALWHPEPGFDSNLENFDGQFFDIGETIFSS
ncbi:hypothetical protein F5Y16DRAFT_315966 [Xylariaceae sp. FL0255]|nr:hypothetical protein F5Y16DRAFT_315966 [Xylariaceae sp. FL0255]